MLALIKRVDSPLLNKLFLFSSLIALQCKVSAEELPPTKAFSIYCNSNLDGTGRCVRDLDSERITCQIIPGAVISCSDKAKQIYECVQYGSIVANLTQTQFACKSESKRLINDTIFNNPFNPSTFSLDQSPESDPFEAPASSPQPKSTPSPKAHPELQPAMIDPFESSMPAPSSQVIPNGF